MNYIGSKKKLCNFIQTTILNVVGNINDAIMCDLFAGTGVIGRTFKSCVRQIIANDFELYSFVLNRNYIGNNWTISSERINELMAMLNNVQPIHHLVTEYYSPAGVDGRMYFTTANGMRIDACRIMLQSLLKHKSINRDEWYFLLASLIESADTVANTTSVYGAYLKSFKNTALQPFMLKPAMFEPTKVRHVVFRQDANKLIQHISGDILYVDPPYCIRQYGANYHFLNTIAAYKPFVPKGVTGLGQYKKSAFCKKRKALYALSALLKTAKFKFIFVSYNDDGIMSQEEIRSIMQELGQYTCITTEHKRFKADADASRTYVGEPTTEQLHILIKPDTRNK